jgi:hypothetical protein
MHLALDYGFEIKTSGRDMRVSLMAYYPFSGRRQWFGHDLAVAIRACPFGRYWDNARVDHITDVSDLRPRADGERSDWPLFVAYDSLRQIRWSWPLELELEEAWLQLCASLCSRAGDVFELIRLLHHPTTRISDENKRALLTPWLREASLQVPHTDRRSNNLISFGNVRCRAGLQLNYCLETGDFTNLRGDFEGVYDHRVIEQWRQQRFPNDYKQDDPVILVVVLDPELLEGMTQTAALLRQLCDSNVMHVASARSVHEVRSICERCDLNPALVVFTSHGADFTLRSADDDGVVLSDGRILGARQNMGASSLQLNELFRALLRREGSRLKCVLLDACYLGRSLTLQCLYPLVSRRSSVFVAAFQLQKWIDNANVSALLTSFAVLHCPMPSPQSQLDYVKLMHKRLRADFFHGVSFDTIARHLRDHQWQLSAATLTDLIVAVSIARPSGILGADLDSFVVYSPTFHISFMFGTAWAMQAAQRSSEQACVTQIVVHSREQLSYCNLSGSASCSVM